MQLLAVAGLCWTCRPQVSPISIQWLQLHPWESPEHLGYLGFRQLHSHPGWQWDETKLGNGR